LAEQVVTVEIDLRPLVKRTPSGLIKGRAAPAKRLVGYRQGSGQSSNYSGSPQPIAAIS